MMSAPARDGSPYNIPAIGDFAFDGPKPDQGSRDVNAAIDGVGATCKLDIHFGWEERERSGQTMPGRSQSCEA